jgi:hypothetical protein
MESYYFAFSIKAHYMDGSEDEHGYSSFYVGCVEQLIEFGLSLFKHATNHARAEIVAMGTVPLARLILEIAQMKPPKGQLK